VVLKPLLSCLASMVGFPDRSKPLWRNASDYSLTGWVYIRAIVRWIVVHNSL
jgi:hypothetical protein